MLDASNIYNKKWSFHITTVLFSSHPENTSLYAYPVPTYTYIYICVYYVQTSSFLRNLTKVVPLTTHLPLFFPGVESVHMRYITLLAHKSIDPI